MGSAGGAQATGGSGGMVAGYCQAAIALQHASAGRWAARQRRSSGPTFGIGAGSFLPGGELWAKTHVTPAQQPSMSYVRGLVATNWSR